MTSLVAYHRDALVDRARAAGSVRDVFAAASERMRGLIEFDAAVWLATDPATSLPTAPTRSENMGSWAAPTDACASRRGRKPVPRCSARRYANEVDLVASLSRPLGEAVRDHARSAGPLVETDAGRGPGVLLFAPTGELVSINDDALGWLDELPPDSARQGPFGVRFPMVVAAALMRARAIAEDRDHGSARARLRSTAGRWLVFHASCLRGPDGQVGETALTIEPAKAAEIAPIIVQAYELTTREQQITRLIAQRHGTPHIARRLHLSPHTVRDYVKTIFEKVGVSSRGELVAKLFAEHYGPIHTEPGARERPR